MTLDWIYKYTDMLIGLYHSTGLYVLPKSGNKKENT